MGKEKKRKEIEEKKSLLSFEAEVSLFGLLLFTISLIGMINQGIIGGLLTFILSFCFGSFYWIFLLLGLFYGLYIFINKKRPKIKIGIKLMAVLIILIFGLIWASDGGISSPSIKNALNDYSVRFDYVAISRIRVDLNKVKSLGGGAIGYFLYSLLYTLTSEIGTKLIYLIMVFSSLFILLKPIIKKVYLFVKTTIKKLKIASNLSLKDLEKKEEIKLSTDIEIEPTIKEEKEETITPMEEYDYRKEIFSNKIIEDLKEKKEEKIEKKENKFNIFKETIIEDEKPSNPFINFEEEKQETNNTQIVETKTVSEINPVKPYINYQKEEYTLPPLSLLEENPDNSLNEQLLEEVENSQNILNNKLNELKIKADVSSFTIGPTVTRFEIVPEAGSNTKVSNIESIKNDLMLSIAATKVRMESPIPGMSAVGLEIPNKIRKNVFLKEILENSMDNKELLMVGLGKDINGKSIVICLNKMPHLLIAGQTGSGKSICISSIIISLIMRTDPKEVKLMLIDPKKVEMLLYANMPHLMCPVITDAKKASVALNKVVSEMDKRYDLFSSVGVRNIEGYNQYAIENQIEKMPYLVIIIDELADLMLVASKDVEDSIQRITQLARAAGIHLVVATQRPSVNVITGVIKANIPSRISFAVSSQIDSRTILDSIGAEDLLGKGDMLLSVTGMDLKRIQGAFVSDKEISRVVQYIKQNASTSYMSDFMNLDPEPIPVSIGFETIDETNDDDIYEDIKMFVIKERKASASLLQRKFSIGFIRAARLIDRLEEDGIIGPANGAKPREILVEDKGEENGKN